MLPPFVKPAKHKANRRRWPIFALITVSLVALMCLLSIRWYFSQHCAAAEANQRLESQTKGLPPIRQRRLERESALAHYRQKTTVLDSAHQLRKAAKGFTVVIATYRREDLYRQVVEHYCALTEVDKVLLVWNNPDLDRYPLPSPSSFRCHKNGAHMVEVLPQTTSLVHNRLKYPHKIFTDAVLQVDDDLIINQQDVLRAFSLWKSNPDRLVGFKGRSHFLSNGELYYSYNYGKSYSMVIGSALFYHREFSEIYLSEHPLALRLYDLIERNQAYDDIGFNILAQYFTDLPPNLMSAPTTVLHSKAPSSHAGLSVKSGSWAATRTQGLREASKIFGGCPLRFADETTTRLQYATRSAYWGAVQDFWAYHVQDIAAFFGFNL